MSDKPEDEELPATKHPPPSSMVSLSLGGSREKTIFIDGDFNNSYESRVRASKGNGTFYRNLKCRFCGKSFQSDTPDNVCSDCGKVSK